jgi:coenzyme PQQ precursor peptide PqqA
MVRGCGKSVGFRQSVQDFAAFYSYRNFLAQALAAATVFGLKSSYAALGQKALKRLKGEIPMQWTAPAFEEVCLNCEINSYVSAKL